MKTVKHGREKSKKTSEDGKTFHASRINIVKMTILPKVIYIFNATRMSKDILHKIEKSILKYIRKHKRPQIAKAILSKKSIARGITIPDFKIYHRTITIKTARYWHKNRREEQWIRIEDLDINPHIYSQLIINKGGQNTRWVKDTLFNKCCWENWISICR
jgi:hypothetical protein